MILITRAVHFNIYNFAGKIGNRSESEGSDRVPAIYHRNRHTVPTPYLYYVNPNFLLCFSQISG